MQPVPRRFTRGILAILGSALLIIVGGCAATAGSARPAPWGTGGTADYQLGGGYPPDPHARIVVRDAGDTPAPDVYSVCYVNGFQTQPGEAWPADLVLHEGSQPLTDPDWPEEYFLDIRSAPKRMKILDVLAPRIRDCAARGFRAVELDNLDSFTRAPGIRRAHAVALATELTRAAHDAGIAVAQKNTPQLNTRERRQIGFDFVIAERCLEYHECGKYVSAYGDAVLDIEYDPNPAGVPFERACAGPDAPRWTILRDRDLAPKGAPGHVWVSCPGGVAP